MKKYVFMVMLSVIPAALSKSSEKTEIKETDEIKEIEIEVEEIEIEKLNEKTDWEYFIESLIWEESKGNCMAIGPTNDVGILQITPIYVAEANRILGKKVYTLECRLDSIKSLEMFEIVQSHHNPTQDIDRAIKLHNPRASVNYAIRIKKKFYQLKDISILNN